MASDENVQFTVYRPKSIQRETWTPLLAFAHLSEKAPDAAPGTPDPIAEVQRQAAASLGARANDYANLTHDSKQSVPRKGLISFVPEMEGATFDPPSRSFFWTQPTHREEFLIKADSASTGRTLRGQLTVYCGPLLLAEVPLAIKVEWAGATQPPGDPTIDEMDASRGRPYRKIFASYSNGDLPIVEACAGFAKAIGDDFLSRNVRLRSGEEWGGRLRNMIEDADVFQLFWSENAAKSPLVLQEIQHALSLSRQNFVRPTFWQPQLPCEDAIPAGLKRMHFERLPGIVVPLVEPPKAPATVLLPPPVIAPPASVIKPPPEIKPAVKPIQPPVGPPAVKAPQDAQSLPPPQPRFAPPPPHSPAVKPVVIEPQRPVSRPVVNDSPPVKARSRPLVSKLLFLAPVVAVVTIVMVLRGYFSGGDASQNRTTSMAPGDVAQNAPPLQPKSNSDPRLTLPSGAGQNPPIIPGAVRPARYSFRLLSNATPGSVILHSAALKKELRAFDLAMTIGGAKLSGDERVNKLNSNEADLAIVSLGPVSSLAANADAFHGAARSIVLILSESATASALVSRDTGPRFLDQLNDGNALVFARGTAEDTLARTSLNAFKYSQLPPRSDDVASVEDVFNRLRTTTSEWPTHLYAMPESLAFQAERNRGRILIESAGMDALLISAKLAAAHPNELADFLKAYFKTLASIDTPTGGIENAIVQNSSATPSDAQRLAAHTRWLNATENYTRFGLAAEPTMLALPERLRNDQPLRDLYRAHFHASAVEANRQSAVAELSEQQWRNVRKIAELRDTIGFSRGSDELTAARESDLKDIAAILNLFPECYVIIRGNNYNDRDVAKKRAELVKTYLNQKCAVDRNRMYTEVPLVKDDTAGVSFLLVKPRT